MRNSAAWRQPRHWLILSLLLALAGCGGGGGSTGTGTGSSSGQFTLSTSSLSFTAVVDGQLPASQTIVLQLATGGAMYVGAAWPSASSDPGWAGVQINQVSAATFDVVVSITSTHQAAGTYTATLEVGTGNSSTDILNHQNVQLTYTVKDVIGLSSTDTQPTAYVATPPQSLQISVANPGDAGFNVSSNAQWLIVPAGTQSGTAGQIAAQIDPTGLTPGTYAATVTATDATDSTVKASLGITLTVIAPTITVSATPVTLGGSDGTATADDTASESVTTTPTYPNATWTATVTAQNGGDWLTVSPASGALTSAQPGNFGLAADISALQGGSYDATVDVAVTVQGQTFHQTVPVTLNRSAERLLVSSYGVAFSSFPSSSLLTRALGVYDTDGTTTVSWTASSDSTWLTVTGGGTTGANATAGNLVLTANPTGLTPDEEHVANVTVATTDGVISNQETIRVGLWVGSSDPTTDSVTLPSTIYSTPVATDPVEPYAFVTEGGTDILVYNVYTGALVTTYSNVGQSLWAMAVSDDGRMLYVEDQGTDSIVPVTVATGAVGTPYDLTVPLGQNETLAYGKVADEPFLVSGSGVGIDLASSTVYPSLVAASAWAAIAPDGRAVGTLDTQLDPSTLKMYGVSYSTLTGKIAVAATGESEPGFNGADLAATVDGSGNDLFVAADAAQPDFKEYSTTGQLLQEFAADEYLAAVTAGWNGVIVGGALVGSGSEDIWAYSAAGTLLGTVYAPPANSSLANRVVRLSGDATRMTAITEDLSGNVRLVFISVP